MRRLPAEWERQECIQLTWPHPNTDWDSAPGLLQEAEQCYIRIATEIASRERLLIVTPEPEAVMNVLQEHLPMESLLRISLLECPTDDTWARDHGFITLLTDKGREYLDFRFNGWGGKYPAEQDNAISSHLFDSGLLPKGKYVDCLDFELEGGSIESDGRGTLLTTARCNLNANRRVGMGRTPEEVKDAVEEVLRQRLGAKRVLWLESGGLEQDDTDGHIDTLARLCPNDTIVYGEGDAEMLEELKAFRTEDGRAYRLVAVPPYYANFLIMNGAVLVPFYEDEKQNEVARKALQSVFPDREIVGIDCRVLLKQNGSLHCCTMQYPVRGNESWVRGNE